MINQTYNPRFCLFFFFGFNRCKDRIAGFVGVKRKKKDLEGKVLSSVMHVVLDMPARHPHENVF